MSTPEDDYLCVGVCMDDADGYCLGCGRPPLSALLAMPENTGVRNDEQAPAEAEAGVERQTG